MIMMTKRHLVKPDSCFTFKNTACSHLKKPAYMLEFNIANVSKNMSIKKKNALHFTNSQMLLFLIVVSKSLQNNKVMFNLIFI